MTSSQHTHPPRARLAWFTALWLSLPIFACNNQGASLGGGGGITELYLRNDQAEAVQVSFEVLEGSLAKDGTVEAPAGERTFLVEELSNGPLLPSEILTRLEVQDLDGQVTLLLIDELDDTSWTGADNNAFVHSEYELVLVPDDS